MRKRFGDRTMETLVLASGLFVIVLIGAIFYFLASESRFAFQQKFPWGFRFAGVASDAPVGELDQDPYSSLLASHPDGAEGLDEKEEGVLAPTLEELTGTARFGSGSLIGADLYRDDWRSPKSAGKGTSFRLMVFATPEHRGSDMALAWQPDAGFDPAWSPYRITLRLVSTPQGVSVPPIEVNLKERPRGKVVVPAYIARTDDDRGRGYVFEVRAEPGAGGFATTVRNFFRTQWNPTSAYAQFGFMPLLVGTALVTVLSVLLATPISIALAVYLSEIAPSRLREWLKPTIELLASIPTVVLGYFGLMLIAPHLQNTLGAALGISSGRALLTTVIVMAVLLVPTIATFAEDSLRTVPGLMRDGAEALGMTLRESLKLVVLPAAKAGVVAAVLLGFARAMGETMIVWILSGGTPTMPSFGSTSDAVANLMRPMRGIPDTVAIETANVTFEEPHYGHLFLLGLSLFALTLLINLVGYRLGRRHAWR